MVLDIFALCERAELTDGRLSIHRALSLFRGQPGIAPPFDIIARLRYEPHEVGPHAFRFIFLTDDGAEMGPPLVGERAAGPLAGAPFGSLSLVAHVSGLTLQRSGVCACHLEIDGEELSALPFLVSVG